MHRVLLYAINGYMKTHAFTAKDERPRTAAPPGPSQRHSPSFSAWKSASGRWETATTLPSNLRLANDLSAAAASLVDDLVRVRVTARVRVGVRVRVRIRVRVRPLGGRPFDV